MALNKNDVEALETWGEATYKAIPKSVFALAAWHLANACCESLDSNEETTARFIEEIEALGANGIISPAQAKRAAKALRANAA